MPERSLTDLYDRLCGYHADVKVALDRTVHQGEEIEELFRRANEHSVEIAKAKGTAATIGVLMSGAAVFVIEAAKGFLHK